MHPCPSCAAPLDPEGFCPSCGALSRGFFRALDLGIPQIADAVARGLDFYRLLEVSVSADIRVIARRYRQLRARFPDDPGRLQPEPARRLALLEVAGRVLTDPQLRRSYDQLRASNKVEIDLRALRCLSCAAPLPAGAKACVYCCTPLPVAPQPPPAPSPGTLLPEAEPIDYYALLGVTPTHLIAPESTVVRDTAIVAGVMGAQALLAGVGLLPIRVRLKMPEAEFATPPSSDELNIALSRRLRELQLKQGITPEERAAQAEQYQIGYSILVDSRWRNNYDALLRSFHQGHLANGSLEALHQLQNEVRASFRGRGSGVALDQVDRQVQQAYGYLEGGIPSQALDILQRVVEVAPESAEAHAGFIRAILAIGDLFTATPHTLRRISMSLTALERLSAALPNQAALVALSRGLLARDAGDTQQAEAELRQAARMDSQLLAAWHGLAALALGRGAVEDCLEACRGALALESRDERALMLMVGAYLRARQRGLALEVAGQVARNRGRGWSAERVLREAGG